jgi:hypothetical protein
MQVFYLKYSFLANLPENYSHLQVKFAILYKTDIKVGYFPVAANLSFNQIITTSVNP